MSDENLKKQGWILSESGLKSIDGNCKNIVKSLLDRDLREIGAGISDLHKGKFDNIDYELVVLQILKIRNISAPKANENSKTAPKLLKLQLTDGQNTYSAIEMEPTALSLETRPGTKISLKVKQLKFANGQLLLTPKNMEILGGYVESLVSKWEISRSLANQMKGNRSGTAPPFIPFGQKIQQNLPNDRSFKSLQQNKQKDGEENSEFNAQRQDAIAEATKSGTRKTFGGGNKTLVDSNVQKVMDKGYTEEQATVALRFARNNVEKALGNLKKREERQQRANSNDYDTRENSKDNKRGGKGSANADPPPAKPSSGVSLFDFLENKIPETTAKQSSYNQHERFENNISSSFRKHDKENSNQKSQQWSQYSASSETKSSQSYKGSTHNARGDYRNNDSSREHRDYNKNKDSRDGPRDSKYSHQHHSQSSNSYSSKSNNVGSSNMYSAKQQQHQQPPHHQSSMMNQKPSNVNNGASSSYNSSNMNSYNKGKYGQKAEYNGRGNAPPKEYNSNYSSSSGANNNSNANAYSSNKRSNTVPNFQQQQQHSNDMYQKQQHRGVVESMEKMSLKVNHREQQQSHSYKSYDSHDSKPSSYQPMNEPPPKQQQQNYPKSASSYSIVGFQSKEANEQAKNALKTKNIPGAPNWQQQQQQQQQQQALPVTVISQPPMKAQPPPFATSNMSVPQTQTAQPMHQQPTVGVMQPQPFVQHPVMHAMPQPIIASNQPAAVFHATPISYPAPIIMQSVQAPPPQLQAVPPPPTSFKVGDLCLAKYWEDGKYYNAKITNVSDSTYVVLFTDYGNAEEVRKSDCVPLMPTCPTPPHSQPPMTNFVQPPQMGTYPIATQQQQQPQQPQHSQQPHNYHIQQQSHSMPYKGGKNLRRN